jgi:hypothetical protein
MDQRHAIDALVEVELQPYYEKLVRFTSRSASQSTSQSASQTTSQAPKKPSLLLDQLTNDDWHVIASYLKLMKPLKDATMKL